MTLTRIGVSLLALAALTACNQSEQGDEAVTETSETPAAETEIANAETETASAEDPFLWLEEVEGERALAQVEDWNAATLDDLQADPLYDTLYSQALEIVTSDENIATPSQRGEYIYNFWQDEDHVKGIWRRTSRESYLSGDPDWDVLLDIDALNEAEGESWVYRGASCAPPDYNRCMVTLSPGGSDAAERREFDIESRSFVEDGFYLPVAKGGASWLDENTLLVATDFGEGTMTESGYPFVNKRWERGQDLSEATEILRGDATDVGVWPGVTHTEERSYVFFSEADTFFESTTWIMGEDGEPVVLPIPAMSGVNTIYQGHALVSLQEDWSPESGGEFSAGELVAFDLDAFLETGEIGDVRSVYAPDSRSALQGASATAEGVIVSITENVQGQAWLFKPGEDGAWNGQRIPLPENAVVSLNDADRHSSLAFFRVESMLESDTLYAVDLTDMSLQTADQLPSWFDASTMTVEQRTATSTDGTEIPYFVMRQQGAEDGGPTLLYGYGGFQITMNPAYSATRGKLWVERGGTFVLANIRGGGEFGPAWHQAGLKTQRQIIYDDFIAIGEDLIETGVATPETLGIMGGSNGGLLMGVMYNQRPDLWGAVVCQVPLLDMLRFHKLLAGASWVGEYGSPEIPEERAFLETISPYHNVDPDGDYPPIFFLTSTKDDRVHPGHARKMAALLDSAGLEFDYYENTQGGHSAAADQVETAKRLALEYTWLWSQLGGEG